LVLEHCVAGARNLESCRRRSRALCSAVQFPQPSTPQTPLLPHPTALKIACSAHAPRPQVDFVIYKLGKRLSNEHWVVALKSLMVFHRLARECDPSFQEQLVRFCDRTGRQRMLCLDRYADHTTRETWDYSAWIRAYGVFLDERLDAFR
jgi:hypothetical protein